MIRGLLEGKRQVRTSRRPKKFEGGRPRSLIVFPCVMRTIKPYNDRRGARECDSRARAALGVAIRGGNSHLDSHGGPRDEEAFGELLASV